ncbi:type IV pilus modification protein PilV [Marinospirillum alkaliphilum]|uniref:Type IV pilus modification protein PilV n=1 Tax=Marinospirillum alkaliphilum DSM 21637 TaxID=1122209 RepID=A0A1K1W5F1_9GAMM|nr:type IV pilus modification protein PilV [Marinospirillum alkaliphilum]SFX32602.1 type IV pilus modification protein PilV [Marinospirillum alkaliphilum DSM 21637]
MMKRVTQHQQQGFTLIEVLVAGVIVVIGLIAMVTLQVRGQQQAFEAHNRNMAAMMAQDMAERLRLNLCYLAIEDEAQMNALIGSDMDDFLSRIRTGWASDHLTGTRSGWTAVLVADYEDANAGNTAAKRQKIEENRYWRFDFSINFNNPANTIIHQSLVVEYRNACN